MCIDFELEYFSCYFTDEYIPISSSYKSQKTSQCIQFNSEYLFKNRQKLTIVSDIIEHLSMSYTDYCFTLYNSNYGIMIPSLLFIEKSSKFSS